jgi:hypothetical protein
LRLLGTDRARSWAAVKMIFTVVGNALGFAANVLDLVD